MKRLLARTLPLRALPLLALAGVLFFFAPAAHAQGSGPRLPNPGFRSIGLWDQTIPIRMDIAVWYPSSRLPREILLEGWSLRAAQNGAATPGKYPVILVSHTTAASRLASHDLAAALTRHGFLVIAPTHPTDNADDTSGIYHAALFADRPEHLLLALDAVERSPIFRPIMDRSRIGVLGVGAGAATALQLAGARPDLSRIALSCPDGSYENPLCSRWAKSFHQRMRDEFAALLASGPEKFIPVIQQKPEQLSGDANPDEPAHAPANAERPVPSGSVPDPAPDPGEMFGPPSPPKIQPVLAVGLLTPGLVELFPDASLLALTTPVGILTAANDTLYPSGNSLDRLQKLLPQRPASRMLQNAGHSDVQAPCPPVYLESFPALCGNQNPEADDFRTIRNEFFIRFFQKTLGYPRDSF